MVWINELHYDNAGTDTGEFIEIAGLAGTNLSGYSLVLYNGNGGASYGTINLSGSLGDLQNGFGALSFAAAGIQNGAPDGVALVQTVNGVASVLQFLSYEGSFTATNGAASGQTSTDIGVGEPDTTPAGFSLQLTGTGDSYDDFTWAGPSDDTPGAVNAGQTFQAPGPGARVSVGDATVAEGANGSAATLTFTVTRSGDTSTTFTVGYATSDGTALAEQDYTAETGTISFAEGQATATVEIAVTGDDAFEPDETLTLTLSDATNGAAIDDGAATGTIENDDVALTAIGAIQGLGHTSEFVGDTVTTQGVVTAIASNGFYLQDGGDNDARTSDGIFVFTSARPTLAVGNEVRVEGTVAEFLPGGDAGNLTITQITTTAAGIDLIDAAGTLPEATVIGTGGRVPPGTVIDDDGLASYDPASDGIDFYESLEGMYVQVNDAVAVGPTSAFGEIAVIADNGARVDPQDRTPNGGIILEGDGRTGEITDPNPERIIVDDVLVSREPLVNTGATFVEPITGVISYSFGNFKLLNDRPLEVATNPAAPESTALRGNLDRLTVATFNVENLDPKIEDQNLVEGRNPNNVDDDGPRFAQIAERIFENLHAPDIVALQEIQDNSGAQLDDVVAADRTLSRLVEAINQLAEQSGSPARYAFLDNPFIADDENGGQPGGNIRNAYIYRTDRVDFVDGSLSTIDANGDATTAVGTNADPSNPFNDSRLPLVATFRFNGEDVTIVNNHFSSKGGDDALFGAIQPPVENTEAQRIAQAEAVNAFVESRLDASGNGNVMVVGDLNDFQFSETLNALRGVADGSPILADLISQLPANEQYEYIFEGNSQVLDHILTSRSLTDSALFDAVHINADFASPIRVSDHDPLLASLYIPASRTLVGDGGDNVLRGRGAGDTISGAAGEDLIVGQDGNDSLDGGAGDDDLYGGNGRDTVKGGEGNDFVAAGQGNDEVAGEAGSDRLFGHGGDDAVAGGADDDYVAGGFGDDDLAGDAGNDSLFGGDGSDLLNGGGGDDTLIGGAGADTFVFAPGDGRDLIRAFGSADRIDLSAFGFGSASEAFESYDAGTRTLDLGNGDQVRILGEILTEDQIEVGGGGMPVAGADDAFSGL